MSDTSSDKAAAQSIPEEATEAANAGTTTPPDPAQSDPGNDGTVEGAPTPEASPEAQATDDPATGSDEQTAGSAQETDPGDQDNPATTAPIE